jgi:hypothetical protein
MLLLLVFLMLVLLQFHEIHTGRMRWWGWLWLLGLIQVWFHVPTFPRGRGHWRTDVLLWDLHLLLLLLLRCSLLLCFGLSFLPFGGSGLEDFFCTISQLFHRVLRVKFGIHSILVWHFHAIM